MSNRRQFKGIAAKAVVVWGAAIPLYSILFVSGALNWLGIYLLALQNAAIVLAGITVLVFLFYPAKKSAPRDRLPFYDVLLILFTLIPCAYLVFAYSLVEIHLRYGVPSNVEMALGSMLLISIFEASRRTMGVAMLIVALFFLLQVTYSNYFPGFLRGRGYDLDRLMLFLYLSSEAIFGIALQTVCTVVVMFLIFGQFIERSGVGVFFTDLAFSLLGRVRGGPAKVAVVATAMFGTISGATTANIATTGVFTIPLMKKVGYTAEFAGAVEAVSGNGGQIMPPIMGVIAFILADWLAMPYWEVCKTALLPALLYYIAEFIQVDFEAAKSGLRGLPRNELPSVWKTLRGGWYLFIPPVALVCFMAFGGFSPQMSALFALVILLLITMPNKERRLGAKKFVEALKDSSNLMASVIPVVAVAGVIMGSVMLSGLGFNLSTILVSVAGGNLLLLLVLTATASFILGMGLTSIPCYVILVLLVAPALIDMGVLPIAAHLFVFYFGIVSFITPPVAMGTFVASGIAGSDVWKTGWQAVRLGIVTYIVPFMFVYNPALLLRGSSPVETVVGAFLAIVGTGALAAGVSGYVLKRTGWVERILLLLAAFLLMLAGLVTNIVGGVLVVGILSWQILAVRATRRHMVA